jgi:nucleotide-binding universal stress UspA family protein
VTPKVLSGDPGETLKDFAEANQVDLVIVGSRGLGFIKRYCIFYDVIVFVKRFLIHIYV